MDKYEGIVKKFIFKGESDFYRVLILEIDNQDDLICIGQFPNVEISDKLIVYGNIGVNKYGSINFITKKFDIVKQDIKEKIFKFLSNGNIKFIGPKLAKKIIEEFGEETQDVLSSNPKKLALVKGISLSRAKIIVEEFNNNINKINTYTYLMELGISANQINKIYDKYEDCTKDVLHENPYILIEDIQGIGFGIADNIALKMGVEKNGESRKLAAIIYILQNAQMDGHIFLTVEEILNEIFSLIDIRIDEEEFRGLIISLIQQKKLYVDLCVDDRFSYSRIYLYKNYELECEIARNLVSLCCCESLYDKNIDRYIHNFQVKEGIELDILQKEALKKALINNVVIVTGGPGTGKTTLIKALINIYNDEKKVVKLAAPTACAAKRMSNVTDMFPASTIHRLLEVKPNEKNHYLEFGKNEEDKIDADVIIIDEVSMLDMSLAKHLFLAIKKGTKVIFFGDKNQLPAVGLGNLLEDMINSDVIPVICLQKVYRQNNRESKIIKVANCILNRDEIDFNSESEDDLFFIKIKDNDFEHQLIDLMERVSIKAGVQIPDIQIITPQWNGKYGINSINEIVQNKINNDELSCDFGNDLIYKVGDKVIHTRNNYFKEYEAKGEDNSSGIYNGDVGYVSDVDDIDKAIYVEYPDKRVTYTVSDINELNLAYAISVHKSQGSEYPAIIIVLGNDISHKLRQKKLLYTAITRAKSIVIIMTHEKVILDIINNNRDYKRNTSLEEKIRDEYNKRVY